jgi:hypothetical protein
MTESESQGQFKAVTINATAWGPTIPGALERVAVFQILHLICSVM